MDNAIVNIHFWLCSNYVLWL